MRDRKGAFMTFLARGFDVKTDERSWRVGANGEETVGGRLEELRADGWQLLHSVCHLACIWAGMTGRPRSSPLYLACAPKEATVSRASKTGLINFMLLLPYFTDTR